MYAELKGRKRVIQKYGGTSVGDIERIRAVAKRTARLRLQTHYEIAIVVSAMAGETNRLVSMVQGINPKASPLSYDMVVAAGEQVAVGLLGAALELEGLKVQPFLAHQVGILTDDFHSRARILSIRANAIEDAWLQGRIPVIAGFQGVTESLQLTTLGRGGSDTSAVALAVALGADFCEINTDVDGVFTADPRIVPRARLIERLDYEVALEMASLGSKVLHSRCVELGAKYKMPMTVRNTFKPDHARRTRVMSYSSHEALEAPVVSGITLDSNVAVISISGLKLDDRMVADIFTKVASFGINVDIIVHSGSGGEERSRLGFTVPNDDLDMAMTAINELFSVQSGEGFHVVGQKGFAKVSAVGVGMASHSGVAAKVFSTLVQNGIAIHMISTSEIKISCVVQGDKGTEASNVMHSAFL